MFRSAVMILMLAGCVTVDPVATGPDSPAVVATPIAAVEGREWHALEIDGVAVIPGSTASLRLENGRASGRVCNGYGGPYEFLAGQQVRFGALAATRMSCGEAMDGQERRFFELLGQTMRYSVHRNSEGTYLTLTGDDGRTIRFRHGTASGRVVQPA